MVFNHIGYAVNSLCEAIEVFELLGISFDKKIIDSDRFVEICFGTCDNCTFELIAPLDESSPVSNLLKRNGNGPYHLCFATDNIDVEIERLHEKGFIIVEKPNPAVAFDNKRVCFLYHKNIGIIELVESNI